MNSPRDFHNIVRSATSEASASRQELGCNFAAEFLKNPDAFDPRKLMTLGRVGLSSFMAEVGLPTIEIAKARVEAANDSFVEDEPADWKGQQRISIPFEIVGLLLGVLYGSAIIFGIALVVGI